MIMLKVDDGDRNTSAPTEDSPSCRFGTTVSKRSFTFDGTVER